MQLSTFPIQLALCMSLCIPVAMAEGFAVPDKEQRQGMSYEEYAKYREHMRSQMHKMRPESGGNEAAGSTGGKAGNMQGDSQYGQGYHSRTPAEGRPDRGPDSRPERHQFERLNRPDRGR